MALPRFFLSLLFLARIGPAQAAHGAKPLTIAQKEACNEIAAPHFSAQALQAGRIADFLADVLIINNLQQHAVKAYTLEQHKALLLAVTPTDVAQAQREYRSAVQRVLATSQLESYTTLCRHHNGTMMPLDAVELAVR